jgi:hypothetical protein
MTSLVSEKLVKDLFLNTEFKIRTRFTNVWIAILNEFQ